MLIGDVLIGTSASAFRSMSDLSDAVAQAGSGVLHLRFQRGDNAREREVSVSFEGRSRKKAA